MGGEHFGARQMRKRCADEGGALHVQVASFQQLPIRETSARPEALPRHIQHPGRDKPGTGPMHAGPLGFDEQSAELDGDDPVRSTSVERPDGIAGREVLLDHREEVGFEHIRAADHVWNLGRLVAAVWRPCRSRGGRTRRRAAVTAVLFGDQPERVASVHSTAYRRSVTAREDVLRAARQLAGDSVDGSFTVDEVVELARRHGSTAKESTIRTHVTSRMCVDAPDNHAVTYPGLVRVDRGRYRLA